MAHACSTAVLRGISIGWPLAFAMEVAGVVSDTPRPLTIHLDEPAPLNLSQSGLPIHAYVPDGHISAQRHPTGWQFYWAGSSSYRTGGTSLETQTLSPANPLLVAGESAKDFDNGGAWLMSVIASTGHMMVGFYHAEDHLFSGVRSPDGTAWKSIARCVSQDGGAQWQKDAQILTSSSIKPDQPAWGGAGDACVVRDPHSGRWFCFFQEHTLRLAVSDDPEARPGTWRKWYEGAFREPGLGGRSTPIEALASRPGANPSVHFNQSIQCWFMVWHTWDGDLFYSTSDDLIRWDIPRTLLDCTPPAKAWYPTIIGESDTQAGATAELLYAYWPDRRQWERTPIRRHIRIERPTP